MAKRGRAEDGVASSSVVTPLAPGAAGALALFEGEVVRLEEPGTQLVLGGAAAGPGKLFVTTQRLAWMPDAPGGQGFAIRYPDIVLHAVCRDADAYDAPCIFCQLNSGDADDDMAGDAGDASASELRLVPANAAALDTIFEAMSACAELHPDAAADDDGDEAFGGGDSAMFGSGLGMGGPGEHACCALWGSQLERIGPFRLTRHCPSLLLQARWRLSAACSRLRRGSRGRAMTKTRRRLRGRRGSSTTPRCPESRAEGRACQRARP